MLAVIKCILFSALIFIHSCKKDNKATSKANTVDNTQAMSYELSGNLDEVNFYSSSLLFSKIDCGKKIKVGNDTSIIFGLGNLYPPPSAPAGLIAPVSFGLVIKQYQGSGNYIIDYSKVESLSGGKFEIYSEDIRLKTGSRNFMTLNHLSLPDSYCVSKITESSMKIDLIVSCRNLYSQTSSLTPKDLEIKLFCTLNSRF